MYTVSLRMGQKHEPILQWLSPQYMVARSPKMFQLEVLHEAALQGRR
jgi:hypothetical protein